MVKEIDVLPDFACRPIPLGEVKTFCYERTAAQEIGKGITSDDAISVLEWMLAVRSFEQMIVSLKDGSVKPYEGFSFSGATHLSLGQEAVAVGTMAALRGDDYITSTHRGHGHAIAKGGYALAVERAN